MKFSDKSRKLIDNFLILNFDGSLEFIGYINSMQYVYTF